MAPCPQRLRQPSGSPAKTYWVPFAIPLLLFFAHTLGLVNFQEHHALDFRMLMRGKQPAHEDLILVEIDDVSLQKIGPWPWPAEAHARMLEILQGYGPRLVIYDTFLPGDDAEQDASERLAHAIEKQANVILPFLYRSLEPFEAVFPARPLMESARDIGFVNFLPDADGHIRRIRCSIATRDGIHYHLAVQAVLSQFRDEEAARKWLAGIPVDHEGGMLIHYPGPMDAFKRISFGDVPELHEGNTEELARLLGGRILVIGHTASTGIHLQPAVFSPLYAGIAIHASAIHTFLSGKYLKQAGDAGLLIVLLTLCLLVWWGSLNLGTRKALFYALALGAFYVFLSQWIYQAWGILLPLVMPLIAVFLTYVSFLFIRDLDMRFRDELIGRELAMAARIQASFLSDSSPKMPGVDMAVNYHFAKHVGGDFYDWMDLGDGRLAAAVGDVSGKGVPAAIYMARAISEFRRESHPQREPSEVLSVLNHVLATRAYAGMFLTMTYVVADKSRNILSISSAGHEPLIHYDGRTGNVRTIEHKKGPPVGVFTDARYETVMIPIGEGDVVLLISDGVRELRNPKGVMMGTEAVLEYLRENAAYLDAQELVAGLLRSMSLHRREAPVSDDQTILAIKFGTRF